MFITKKELQKAIDYFENTSTRKLKRKIDSINNRQPVLDQFIVVIGKSNLLWDMIEDIIISIYIIYYAHTEVKKRRFGKIDEGALLENTIAFDKFLLFFLKESKHNDSIDFARANFIRDRVALTYCFTMLSDIFGGAKNIPREILLPYFGLLKTIELEAQRPMKINNGSTNSQ